MAELKRITGKELLQLARENKDKDLLGSPTDWAKFGIKIQLEADQKAHDAVIREIFERIEGLGLGIYHHSMAVDHYDNQGNEVMEHQPDCLKCKFEKIKHKYLGGK
ncbi:MAG: hypothetical protein KAR06_04855 [Deltaproteobacteria bacterium]|nr:hypothetical protein [Deltaproteobacteria bacterium]